MDTLPFIFRKDLLIHEAVSFPEKRMLLFPLRKQQCLLIFSFLHLNVSHRKQHRHPFIERLGLLYMLKVRHGQKFGTQPGAAWRILFTLALLPWLRKYRIYSVTPIKQKFYSSKIFDSRSSNDLLLARLKALEKENAEMKVLLQEAGNLIGSTRDGAGDPSPDDTVHSKLGDCESAEFKGEERSRWWSIFY